MIIGRRSLSLEAGVQFMIVQQGGTGMIAANQECMHTDGCSGMRVAETGIYVEHLPQVP